MSIATAKTQFVTALGNVTWTVPADAVNIPMCKNTTFQRVDDEQFAEVLDRTKLPYVRVHIPDDNEERFTMGGDSGSLKLRDNQAALFIYWACFAKDWSAGGHYFDAIVDATKAYFRHNASPPIPTSLPSDKIIAWGMHMRSRTELPEEYDDTLHYRATVGVRYTEVVI